LETDLDWSLRAGLVTSLARRIRATLVHNPTAGQREAAAALVASLEQAGYHVNYCSKKSDELAAALADPGELVIVAGGDGTVAKVATALAGRDIPLAILPVGTANNIARTLGLVGGPSHIIAGLRTAPRKRLDVGIARGPWGERRFIEAAGVGVFARAVAVLEDEDGQPLAELVKDEPNFESALRLMRHIIEEYPSREWRLTLDGRDLSGRYVLMEAMNIRLIGPHLHLAPDADPGDGLFDVVLASHDQCAALLKYLGHRLEREATLPALTVHRGRRLELLWVEPEIHFDDNVWLRRTSGRSGGPSSTKPTTPATVVLEMSGQSVEVLVPGP
jgi:diacylglycerol kinase (ATP)